MRSSGSALERTDVRLALALVAPALTVIVLVAIAPVAATFWEALHRHDLRLPWTGKPFIGLANFGEAAADPRFRAAVLHTLGFAATSVVIEMALGLALALTMHSVVRLRTLVRVTALLPWAIPTVVAALAWRLMFDAQAGIVNVPLRATGVVGGEFDWFVDPLAAWVPIIAADVWKTTPFVAILLLAGLQTIDSQLYEAARVDGAGPSRQFITITLPLLRPTLIVAGTFRVLDALRIFDLAYVVTGGGPGTATEPLSLYAFATLMQRLRFGYGSALSLTMFLMTLVLAFVSVRALGRSLAGDRS